MPVVNPFKKATLKNAKIRMALCGVSKGGKTWKALQISTDFIRTLEEHGALTGNGRIAVIDSEFESAQKYADEFDFDHCPIHDFSPETYIKFMKFASDNNYTITLVDSISHEWAGIGGILDYVNGETPKFGGNSFQAWGRGTPKHNSFLDAMIRHPGHIIATIRARMKSVPSLNSDGKMIGVRKIGVRPIQRKETEYDFDAMGDISEEHILTFKGTRCKHLSDRTFTMAETSEVGKILGKWISETYDETAVQENGQEVDKELIEEINKYRDLLKMKHDAFVSLLTMYSASKLENLTHRNAVAVRNHLVSVHEKSQAKTKV